MCEQDIETRRARDLERFHRRTAERRAKGLCLKCGKRLPAPHRSQCEACAEKRRPADRERFHRCTAERVAQGLCTKCVTFRHDTSRTAWPNRTTPHRAKDDGLAPRTRHRALRSGRRPALPAVPASPARDHAAGASPCGALMRSTAALPADAASEHHPVLGLACTYTPHHRPPSLSASAVVVARRFAAHASRSDLRYRTRLPKRWKAGPSPLTR